MPLRTLGSNTSLLVLLHENAFTSGLLQSHPLAAPLTPPFDAFQTEWATVNNARVALVIAAGKAEGGVVAADAALDDFVMQLDATLLIAVKNDRTAPLYQHYFGAQRPSELRRPVLGPELATVRNWIPSLQASTNPALAALAPELQKLVAAADAAVAAKAAADQALKDFDQVGQVQALVNGYNVTRKDAYGKLSQIPHQNPQAMLPGTFADRFFLHGKATDAEVARHDPVELQARIDKHTKEIGVLQGHLTAAQTAAQAHTALKTAAEQEKAALAQAKKDADAAKKKVRDLQAKTKAAVSKAKKPRRRTKR